MISNFALECFKQKRRPSGLYLQLKEKGEIKRTLVTSEKEIELEPTTINDEIILFTDIDFEDYLDKVNGFMRKYCKILIENEATSTDEDLKDYLEIVDRFISDFENDNFLLGFLTRLFIKDTLGNVDIKTSMEKERLYTMLFTENCFLDIVRFKYILTALLYDICDGKEVDFKNKFKLFSHSEFVQIISMEENTSEYYIWSPSYYYLFLLTHFVKNKPNLQICKCCDRFFVPKTKRKTFYCDRILENGKTCKQWGPILKRKLKAENDNVLKAFITNQNKMYKRFERARDSLLPTEKNIYFDEYYTWRDKATGARDKYVAKEISAEEALKIIVVND